VTVVFADIRSLKLVIGWLCLLVWVEADLSPDQQHWGWLYACLWGFVVGRISAVKCRNMW